MSGTVAKIGLPAEEFALYATLQEVDNIEFDVERVVAYDPDRVMPLVWITGNDAETIENALRNDPSVKNLELLTDLDEEQLYQMEWIEQLDTLIEILVEEDGTVLNAFGDETGWELRTLFPDRDSLSRTYDYCTEHGLSMDIRSVYDLDEGRQGRFGLTDEQQDALTIAFDRGYYQVPREVTLKELAAETDTSHQALSEQLRRAHHNVVKNTVIIGEEGVEDPAESN